MKIINLDSPPRMEDLVVAVGEGSMTMRGPQFERLDGKAISIPDDFDQLSFMTCAELKELGCLQWDESGLMLFPYQWYDHIPEGFYVRTINGEDIDFVKGETDNDMRYGVLSYGVTPIDKGPIDAE
jgi:hypothetical protein